MRTIFIDDHKSFIGSYYFFRGDFIKAEQELEVLVNSGVNHLWLFIDDYFRKDNPAPRKDFDLFLELLQKKGLKFVPVIGQFISLTEHPEVRIVMGDGNYSSDPRYWNMGCFRHPVNLEWATYEVREFLRSYHNNELLCRSAGKLLMSFVHEAIYRTDTPEMGGDTMHPNCYCSYCREAFLDYLQTKYTDIEDFNKNHAESIQKWEELKLPLGPKPDPLLWVEFMENHAEAIPDFLSQLIKVANKEAPVLSTHECNDFYPGSWQTTLTGNDFWKMAAVIDFGHEDMYPLEFDQQYQIYIYGFIKDIMRSAMGFSRPYTGNGQAFHPWVIEGKLPKNSMIEQVYTSIIHGVTGLVWWLGGDLELWGEMEEPNEFLDYWLQRLPELEREKPRIALLYSYTTLALTQNDLHPLDLQLIYMGLCQLGLPVDILSEEQIKMGIIQEREYKLVIAPAVSALPRETGEALRLYVSQGGTLLVDYAAEDWPENFPLPVIFRTEALGKKPRYYRTTTELTPPGRELFIPVESPKTGIPVFDNSSRCKVWAEFDSGSPAVVSWQVEKGKIVGVGSMLGVDFANYPGHIHLNKMFPFLIRMNDDARELLRLIAGASGVMPTVISNNTAVEVGIFIRNKGSRVCFAVNHLPKAVECSIIIEPGEKVDVESGSIINVEKMPKGLRVDLEIQELGGAWFEVS